MKMVIIGGGPAGRSAAMEAAQLGAEVFLIEKEHVGGTCLHEGCMVISGLNDVVRFHEDSKNYRKMGIISEELSINYSHLAEGIREITGKIENVLKHETRQSGVEIIMGEAEIAEGKVLLNGEEHPYDKLLIATGSRPFLPSIPGVEQALNYKDVLDLKEVPENLNIVGSGVIAAEFAGIFSSLGSKVTILCRGQFLRNLDSEIKDYIVEHLLNDVKILENSVVSEITSEGALASTGFVDGLVFMATGMVPNSEIAQGMVEIGSKKEIIVNKQMRTSNPSIYAAGDVVGTVGNVPVARREGVIAARNACDISATMDYQLIPQSLNLYYPVSFFDLDNEDNENEFNVRIRGSAGPGSFWHTLDGETGFTKITSNLETGEITRVSSISPSSSTSTPYLAKMIKEGYKTSDFDDFIETHPSTDALYKLLHYLSRYG
ncbi:NAD(P)/FAD-dependent oxidoreductase [Methanobacterium formicicum]|uniref:Dihydrolipoyl dehydrogenase n=1 Tax=Methanobacterium formicicum (strain DSM 3637 / PP1) TaxID=1204725 RepID=K2R4V4_METFP|nr:NAD(P)/FAD-dependent oxidoreductase [Methanobacterium formicicum]EKF86237.1 Dihydrolipoyl dehydrogenase [Methanobacterium formicicum DSM 3637]